MLTLGVLCYSKKSQGVKYDTINDLHNKEYQKRVRCYTQNF